MAYKLKKGRGQDAGLTVDDIVGAIRDPGKLTDDLLDKKWSRIVAEERAKDPNLPFTTGFCSVTTEALYHLSGGKMAGYTAVVGSFWERDAGRGKTDVVYGQAPKGHEQLTHWWVKGPDGPRRGEGKIHDPTFDQMDPGWDYGQGVGCGFQSPRPPSQPARKLISKVAAELGPERLDAFIQAQREAFEKAGGTYDLTDAERRNGPFSVARMLEEDASRERAMGAVKVHAAGRRGKAA